MKYPIDFEKLGSTFAILWEVAHNLSFYVMHYPDQVTAACCLYLAGTRFLTWFRKR